MIELKNLPIYIATHPVDFRASIDGLCLRVVNDFKENPQASVFVFYNKSYDKLKVLCWHHTGFMLVYKRLERGRFHAALEPDESRLSIDEQQLRWLMAGLNWELLKACPELTFTQYG